MEYFAKYLEMKTKYLKLQMKAGGPSHNISDYIPIIYTYFEENINPASGSNFSDKKLNDTYPTM